MNRQVDKKVQLVGARWVPKPNLVGFQYYNFEDFGGALSAEQICADQKAPIST